MKQYQMVIAPSNESGTGRTNMAIVLAERMAELEE